MRSEQPQSKTFGAGAGRRPRRGNRLEEVGGGHQRPQVGSRSAATAKGTAGHAGARVKARRLVPLVGGGLVAILILGALVWIIRDLMADAGPPPKTKVQQITLVTPPPPPPPPKIEEPPPPQEQKIEEPPPEPKPEPEQPKAQDDNEPPPGEDLGVDANGSGSGDAFGLVGKKGGRSLIGGGGDRNRWYAGILQQQLQSVLADNEDIRTGKYSVLVRVWIGRDGKIDRVEIVNSTGDQKLDASLRTALARTPTLREAPPEDLPQPIKLRISSR